MLPGNETVNLTPKSVDKKTNHSLKTIKNELEKFGLSKNQATIYILLIQHGELRIQEIVKLAGIPRSSVYDCLNQLYELGIAEEIIENSYKKVRPYSIGAMRHGLDEHIIKLQRLTHDLESLEKSIALVPTHSLNGTAKVRYYSDRSGARQLYWNTLKAQSTVYVFSDWGRGRYVGMKFYERFVEESRERKIKEKVLINPTPHAIKSIREFTYPDSPISRTRLEDIRAIDKKDMLIKGDALMYDTVYSQIYLKGVQIHGFEIESTHFTDMQRSMFETLWKMAKPITDFL